MSVVIRFDHDEDHEQAIDVLTEAEETYHGVGPATILVSPAAVAALRDKSVRFRVINEPQKETVDAPGS